MKKSNEVYLQDILDAILRIEEYTKDKEYNDFIAINLIQYATIRELEIKWEKIFPILKFTLKIY